MFPGGAGPAVSEGSVLDEGAGLLITEGAGPLLSEEAGLLGSGGGSLCRLPCLEAPEPGISQLSVRRLEPSCIRLVATTAFIAACRRRRTRTMSFSVAANAFHQCSKQ